MMDCDPPPARILQVLSLQALGLPYSMMSASEPMMDCYDFVRANLRQAPTHWFRSLDDQVACTSCALHPERALGCQASPEECDLAVAGTPCHPYSVMHSARFKAGTVEAHKEYEVSMRSFLHWLRKTEPRCVIFEQVPGFTKPFHEGSTETPVHRFLV